MTGFEYYRKFTGRTLEDIGKPIGVSKQKLSYWIKNHVSIPTRYRGPIFSETGIPAEYLEKSDIDELDRKRIEYSVICNMIQKSQNATGEPDEDLLKKLDEIKSDIEVLKELDKIGELVKGRRADKKRLVFDSDEIRLAHRKKMLHLYSKFTDLLCNYPDDSVFIDVVLNALEKINSPEKKKLDSTEEELYRILKRMRKKRTESYDKLKKMQEEMIAYIIDNNL